MVKYSFEDKVALVTGGGRGMGRAIALAYAANGAAVMVSDIDATSGEETAHMITEAGGSAAFCRTDISLSDDVDNMLAATVAKFGRLDFASNTAAIDAARKKLVDLPDEEFDHVIAVNLRGVFLCMKRQVTQLMKQGSGGAIINFSSTGAIKSRSEDNFTYISAKAAVVALSRNLATSYARFGIRINCVVPGSIDTPMLRGTLDHMGISPEQHAANYCAMNRLGTVDEIAKAVMFLSSDEVPYIVAQTLVVDGGASVI